MNTENDGNRQIIIQNPYAKTKMLFFGKVPYSGKITQIYGAT